MRLLAIRLATLFATALVVLALAKCDALTPQSAPSPTPSPPPPTNLKVGSPADQNGSFFMSPGQTLLVELPYAESHDSTVLAVAGHYPKATIFRAAAVGRTWVIADFPVDCPVECNAPAPVHIAVVVVSDQDLEQGVVISEQDHPWIIHFRSGQRFALTLRNLHGSQAWTGLTSANPAVIVPEQAAVISADGIRGQFRAGERGRTGVFATGRVCPSGSACPPSPYISFTFMVFS